MFWEAGSSSDESSDYSDSSYEPSSSSSFSSPDKTNSKSNELKSLPTERPQTDSRNIDQKNQQTKPLSNTDSPKKTDTINAKNAPVGHPSKNAKNSTSGEEKIFPSENPNKKSSMKRSLSNTSSNSSFSFSVSSGTDESLAAKIGNLGTPFAPLSISANFIPNNPNDDYVSISHQSPSNSSRSNNAPSTDTPSTDARGELKRQVLWSDLLGGVNENETKSSTGNDPEGGSKRDGNDDNDDSASYESYESYETALSEEEFETDSETERSKSISPPRIDLDELVEDEESAETSDYETDTTYERKYAVSEGRTPPPPKKPISNPSISYSTNEGSMKSLPFSSPSDRPNFDPMPVVEENEILALDADRGRRRKPFEDVPTAVAAEIREVSKNDPKLSNDGSTPLGITGWDGQGKSNDQGKGGKGNLINQTFKKKGDVNVEENRTNAEALPLLLAPPSPSSYDPPDYDGDDDDISNITDRVFSPKISKPKQSPDLMQERPVSERSLDASGRFSITSFRRSNSVRNTERALEGLKSTSIEPDTTSLSKNGKCDSKRALADIPEGRRERSPALLNMQNEVVDFYFPREHDSSTRSSSDYHDTTRAYDSRDLHDIETQERESELDRDYDPINTEIIEEVFVGYDHEDETNSRFETQRNEEEDAQDGDKNHESTNEKAMKRNSKRLYFISCIVICNLLLLLGIGTWLLIEYFFLNESEASSIEPGLGPPALSPPKSNKTVEDIKAELTAILKPNLPDGGRSFDVKTSPQSEALDWLSNDAQIHTYDEQKVSTRFSLATFYYATDGDNWTTNHLWLTDLDECLWYTSSSENPCTEQRYSRLVLTDNNLQGTIPEELSLLSKSLVNLDLVGTFNGEIPSNIGDLTQLTSLRLSGRLLSGKIPDSLYKLSNLSVLDLGRNLLSGGLSGAIGSLSSSIDSISLMDNHLTGSVPEEIGQLSGLRHFNIDDNYFDVMSEDAIGRLIKLETLSARNNALKGSLPSIFGDSLTNLKGLFLNNNEFTGSIPDSYGNLSKLEVGLDLSSNRLTGRVPESLGQLSMLRNLLIRDNGLSGTIPLSWGNLSTLNTLRLDSTNFEGELPTELCDSFKEASSSFYADCWKLDCPCCNFCCDSDTGDCVCRFEDSLPILCVEP
jgi:hypothetical protein